MAHCPHCGSKAEDDMRFCPSCGKKLQASRKAKPRKRTVLTLILTAAVCLSFGIWGIFSLLPKDFTEDSHSISSASQSVVTLHCYDAHDIPTPSGSGFAVFDQDLILTNYHAIKGDVYAIEAQRTDGSSVSIDSVVFWDEALDIAVLRAPNCGLTPLNTGTGLEVKQGDKVLAIGSGEGISYTVATGIVSSIQSLEGRKMLYTTASVSQGGCALFDNDGKVIGITLGKHTDSASISLPIEYAQAAYVNRSPETEQTVAEFYSLSDHHSTPDDILASANRLQGETVTVKGYISGIHKELYLVTHERDVLGLDTRKMHLQEAYDASVQLNTQAKTGDSLRLQLPSNQSLSQFSAGDLCVAEGIVRYYADNSGRPDICLQVTDITIAE